MQKKILDIYAALRYFQIHKQHGKRKLNFHNQKRRDHMNILYKVKESFQSPYQMQRNIAMVVNTFEKIRSELNENVVPRQKDRIIEHINFFKQHGKYVQKKLQGYLSDTIMNIIEFLGFPRNELSMISDDLVYGYVI